eukprot:TRINITY_DN326_c0_g1_i1.p1 TRINITY_DN326_c0_g1~~TRINITY_DN326_c0_g1_i1.p1  ORF type:complete len:869 (+),score=358.49 TRINITY_DN326_c0_g1_i1:71-2608(+)
MSGVVKVRQQPTGGPDLAPGWVAETIAIWTQFPSRKGILDLTRRNIHTLPEELYRMRKLTSLDLSENLMEVIPGELSKLAEAGLLQILNCSGNQISRIEDDFGKLTSLEEIILNNNLFEELPACLSRLYQISRIELGSNFIKEIPSSINSLIFLQTLVLSNNQITVIPESLCSLNALHVLDLSHNQITSLPNGFDKLHRLKRLLLHHNALEQVPLSVGFLVGLEELTLADNPLSLEPELQGLVGCNKILHYLRNKIRKNLETRKLLFVEKDCSNNVHFEALEGQDRPQLTGITVEKLIVFLTQIADPDEATVDCVKLCYDYFVTPEELFDLLVLRYNMHEDPKDKRESKETKKVNEMIRLKVFNRVREFFEQFNVDNVTFTPSLMDKIDAFLANIDPILQRQIKSVLSENPSTGDRFQIEDKVFQKELLKRKEKDEKDKAKKDKDLKKKWDKEKKKFIGEVKKEKKKPKGKEDEVKLGIGLGLPPGVGGTVVVSENDLLNFTPKLVAQQIALLNFDCFSVIPLHEFIKQRWAKDGKEVTAPNTLKCIQVFNDISAWVSAAILRRKDLRSRVRLLHHFLDVVGELLELGDFSGIFSIASALSCAAVSRLKQTWALLDDRRVAINNTINELTNNSGNYKNYRAELEIRKTAGLCIPYLGNYLSALTFTDEGNTTFYNDTDMLNIGKFRLLTKIIYEIKSFQEMPYHFVIEPDDTLQHVILHSERIYDDKELYEMSLLCEASNRKPTTQAQVLLDEDCSNKDRRNSIGGPFAPGDKTGITASVSMFTLAEAAAASHSRLFFPPPPSPAFLSPTSPHSSSSSSSSSSPSVEMLDLLTPRSRSNTTTGHV